MNHVFQLPNGKSVAVKEFLYKDVREFFYDKPVEARAEFFNSFIITKNLNVLEKFLALVKLRERCIKQSISININGREKEVGIDFILKTFNEILDIREEVIIDNIKLVLDYPTEFIVSSDSLFKIIQTIEIDNEIIDLHKVTEDEYNIITSSLPAQVLKTITDFYHSKKRALVFNLFEGSDVEINFLNSTPFAFLNTLYKCIDANTYREYLFVLSKRMRDATFISNSTFVDVLDYIELYRRENDDEKDKVAKIK